MFEERIRIENYSADWALAFQKLKSVYQLHLSGLIADIEHVGSTSVPGLAAKPVIDIDVIIADIKDLDPVIEKLDKLGYDYRGNLGITDRMAFKRRSDQTPTNGSLQTWQAHNLYVCPAGSISLKNHVTLRDFLRNNPEKAKAYGELKKRLVMENPYDINVYIERKTPFITAILKEAGFDDSAIDMITRENKVSK